MTYFGIKQTHFPEDHTSEKTRTFINYNYGKEMGKDACQIPLFCVCSHILASLKKYETLEKLHSSPSQIEGEKWRGESC